MNSKRAHKTMLFTVNSKVATGAATCILASTMLSGCNTMTQKVARADVENFVEGKPEPLRPLYKTYAIEGETNSVLNLNRIGVAALQIGDLHSASSALDESLSRIEAVYADNKSAEAARKLWNKESEKDYKGEPYERSMAYYYRGLTYLASGDYENARASFRGGLLQDTMAEDQKYDADFGLLSYLEGWASHCAGDKSQKDSAWHEAAMQRPNVPRPSDRHNWLFIADVDNGPIKVAKGEHKNQLAFERGEHTPNHKVTFRVDGKTINAHEMEDIYHQATTRGGRPFDSILDGKVSFKESNEEMGQALTDVGFGVMTGASQMAMANPYAGGSSDAAMIGLGIALFGAVQQAVASAVQTETDTRTWTDLPDSVHVATGRLNRITDVNLEHSNGKSKLSHSKHETVKIFEPTETATCGLVWARSPLGGV